MLESLYAWGAICGFLVWILAIPTVVGLFAFVLLRNARRRTLLLHQAWEDFARANGLTFDKGSTFIYPKVSGTYRHRPITISIFRLHPGRARLYTQVTTSVKMSAETQLQVSQFSQVGSYYQTLPGPDIFMGVGVFANQYRVQGEAAELARSVLDSAVQAAILETGFSHLSLAKGTLTLRVRGWDSQPHQLGAMLDLTCTLAEAIEERG